MPAKGTGAATSTEAMRQKCIVQDDCWLWDGCTDIYGYGLVRHLGRFKKAHRVAYMIANGLTSLDSAVFVCHSCDNRRCVNPAHLWLGNALSNNRDAITKGRKRVHTKLSTTDVKSIRASSETIAALMLQFNASRAQISRIRRGVARTEN